MVIVVPIYEEEITGVYYNTAAVIDADGKYLGKYRKNHIPHVNPGILGKVLFPARATLAIRLLIQLLRASAFTSVTTAIFLKARARSGSTAQR